jgi:Tol biopolymer transport system component
VKIRTLAVLSLLAPTAASPTFGQTCRFTEIASASIDLAGDMWPVLSGSGTAVAFRSDGDLVAGSNADGNAELFLWRASGYQQLTSTAAAPLIAIGPPSISNDGQSAVFSSSRDFVGANADANHEVFLLELPATFTQITNTLGGGPTGILNDGAVISGNGDVLAFSSAADLLGGNADGSIEVYWWQASVGLQQLTVTLADNGFPSTNRTGSAIAHLSPADLVPPLNSDGGREIFVHTPPTVAQVTSTLPADFVDHPRLAQIGGRLVFTSNADLVPPANADHSVELFLFDPSAGFSQLTSTTGPDFIGLPSSDAGASTIVFQSNRDLVPPQNPDGNSEVFVWRFGGGIAQLTSTPPTSHHTNPTVDQTGNLFAYEVVTEARRAVVLADCRVHVTEVPAMSLYAGVLLAAVLAVLGFLVLRRRTTRIHEAGTSVADRLSWSSACKEHTNEARPSIAARDPQPVYRHRSHLCCQGVGALARWRDSVTTDTGALAVHHRFH